MVAALEALQSNVEPLIERLSDEAGEAEERVRDRVAARRLAEDEVALRHEVDELGESKGAALVAVARLEERRAELAARFDQVGSGARDQRVSKRPATTPTRPRCALAWSGSSVVRTA